VAVGIEGGANKDENVEKNAGKGRGVVAVAVVGFYDGQIRPMVYRPAYQRPGRLWALHFTKIYSMPLNLCNPTNRIS